MEFIRNRVFHENRSIYWYLLNLRAKAFITYFSMARSATGKISVVPIRQTGHLNDVVDVRPLNYYIKI